MPPPPVVLDVDGTLVDSNFQHALTWHRAFARHGRAIPAWRTHRAIGMGGDQLVPALAGEEWAAEHGDAVAETEAALFGELIGSVAPLPGARAFLETLKERGHAVVLGSSAKQSDLDVFLDVLDARRLVDAWTVSDDVEQTKPEPDIVHAALAKLGNPGDGVMVGDSVYDIQAAHAAGLPAIGLLTGGFGAQELRDVGAEYVYEDLLELLAKLDESPLRRR
ncbi:HAD family hydrolase [Solirubrobacter soli]|uniref:HAD family hydrolase n=1 Tax=Solirubrobacter soli TaxID=363832 RepID=UPI00047FC7CC|nr:HAD family hydrolase [Solirubrobacter soli]